MGVVRLDDLNELHHLNRVKEMDSNEAVGAARNFAHLRDGE